MRFEDNQQEHDNEIAIIRKKTEFICSGGKEQDFTLEDEHVFGQCDRYKYLGLAVYWETK